MKYSNQIDEEARFKGQLRHYHRSGSKERRTWDEWVEGEETKPSVWLKVLKITGIIVALLALGAIVAGLVSALQ
jgi:hypothetical protein